MKIRAVYFRCKLSRPMGNVHGWSESTPSRNKLQLWRKYYTKSEYIKSDLLLKGNRFFCKRAATGIQWTSVENYSKSLDKTMRDHNHNYDNTCHFSLHLHFNPCLKIASIPSHSGASNTLSSRIGFFKELSSLRTTAKERRRLHFQDQNFGREIFSEAMRSYFWDYQDESLYAEPSSVGNVVENRNIVRFSSQAIFSLHLGRQYGSHFSSTIPYAHIVINKLIIFIINVDGHSFGTTS